MAKKKNVLPSKTGLAKTGPDVYIRYKNHDMQYLLTQH